MKKGYDAFNVCSNPVQQARATRSAFVDERLAFDYVIIFTFSRFKPITFVLQNSDLAKE